MSICRISGVDTGASSPSVDCHPATFTREREGNFEELIPSPISVTKISGQAVVQRRLLTDRKTSNNRRLSARSLLLL